MSSGASGQSWRLRLLLLLWCAVPAMAQGTTREEAYQKSVPFSHYWHVPAEWLTVKNRNNDENNKDETQNRARLLGETPRDCRGCHVYEQDKTGDPQQACAACHYLPGTIDIKAAPGFAQDLNRMRGRITPFAHHDHGPIGCKACHEPPSGRIALPNQLPVIDGTALCFRCHRDRDPNDPRTKDWAPNGRFEWLRSPDAPDGGHGRFLARLNRDPSMGPEGFAPFFHRDHIAPANRGSSTDCAPCHGSVKDADARTLAAARVSPSSLRACVACHRTEAGVVEFELEPGERPSLAAGAFHHQDHLKADSKYPALSCTDCHEHRPLGAGNDYPLRPEYAGPKVYQGCATCHSRMKVESQPLLLDHGEVTGCVACHALGQGKMATQRPADPAARPRPAFFLVDAQTHPFLTTSMGQRETACFEVCHRADVERLPSRVDRRRFDHKSHLPPTPSAKDCERCHKGIRTSSAANLTSTYDTLAGAAGEAIAQPDPAVCGECHKGSVLVAEREDAAATAGRKPPLRFPHDQHLGPRTRALAADQVASMDCITCHVPSAQAGADVGTTAAALTCQPCHRHEQWQAEITGKKDRSYVQACVDCHESHGSLVPADEAVVVVPTQRVKGVRNTQFHPRSDACERCHVGAEETPRKAESHLSAQLSRVHKKEGKDPDPKTTDCLTCHWDLNLDGALESLKFNDRFRAFQRQSKAGTPLRQQIRSFFGGELGNYPGKGRAK